MHAGQYKPGRAGSDLSSAALCLAACHQVFTWRHTSCPSREHRTMDSAPGEVAQHRPWELSLGEMPLSAAHCRHATGWKKFQTSKQ